MRVKTIYLSPSPNRSFILLPARTSPARTSCSLPHFEAPSSFQKLPSASAEHIHARPRTNVAQCEVVQDGAKVRNLVDVKLNFISTAFAATARKRATYVLDAVDERNRDQKMQRRGLAHALFCREAHSPASTRVVHTHTGIRFVRMSNVHSTNSM